VCKITTRHVSYPYRHLPLSAGAPDTIDAVARSSRTARMTVFMMIALLRWTADGMLWLVMATVFITGTVRMKN
jgi:hypothetical protein